MQLDSVEALVDTLDNASTQIQSLNPTSFEGANLLLTGPGQFFDNQLTFADGVVDWKVDTGTLVGALTIASNPAYNDAWLQHSGTDIRDEIATSLRATASAAAEDPDAFAATVVDWKGLEDDPTRWAGNQAPEVLIEVLTAGTAAAPLTKSAPSTMSFDSVISPMGVKMASAKGSTRDITGPYSCRTPTVEVWFAVGPLLGPPGHTVGSLSAA